MTDKLRAAIVALLDSLDAHADIADDWEYDNDGETTRPWQQTSQFVALVDEVKRLMKGRDCEYPTSRGEEVEDG